MTMVILFELPVAVTHISGFLDTYPYWVVVLAIGSTGSGLLAERLMLSRCPLSGLQKFCVAKNITRPNYYPCDDEKRIASPSIVAQMVTYL